VLVDKSRTKHNIGREVATILAIMRISFMVTRPINAETESVSPANFKVGRWY